MKLLGLVATVVLIASGGTYVYAQTSAQLTNTSPVTVAYICPFQPFQATASDPEGDQLTFQWDVVAPAPGEFMFTSPNTLHTDFCVIKPGSYNVTLTVSDGGNIVTDSMVATYR